MSLKVSSAYDAIKDEIKSVLNTFYIEALGEFNITSSLVLERDKFDLPKNPFHIKTPSYKELKVTLSLTNSCNAVFMKDNDLNILSADAKTLVIQNFLV